MRKTVLILLIFNLSHFLSNAGAADTIDYWSVYLNNKLLHSYNMYDKYEITLKASALTARDSITVRYGTDTPCDDCLFYLTIENEKHRLVTVKTKGEYNPLTFSVKELIDYKKKNGKFLFDVFYSEGEIRNTSSNIPIFRIKLE